MKRPISNKSIAIIGLGTIGSLALLGTLGIRPKKLLIVDRDIVEEHNIGQQLLYSKDDIGKPKAEAAFLKIHPRAAALGISLGRQIAHLSHENISMLQDYSLILDCTDNMQTRFLINDFCRKKKKPWIYAAAVRNIGNVFPVLPGKPCLSCIMPNARSDESCALSGIELPAAITVSSLQLSIAQKILKGKKITPKLERLTINPNSYSQINVKKSESCPACHEIFDFLGGKKADTSARLCSQGMYQITPAAKWKIKDFQAARKKFSKTTGFHNFGQCIKIGHISLFPDGRALVKADSQARALALYSRFLGS